jgi:hypothetical protein
MTDSRDILLWYTRREGVVRGPFSAENITRHILLGRIRLDDELSHDHETWLLTNECASMLPDELSKLSGWDDYKRLVEARLKADERKGDQRCQNCKNRENCHGEQRQGSDRRHSNNEVPVSQFLAGASRPRQPSHQQPGLLRTLLLGLLLSLTMFVWLMPAHR